MPELPVLSWLNDRFNDWGEHVLDDKILGQGLRVARQATKLGGPNPVSLLVNNPLTSPSSADADAADTAGLTGKAWVDQAYRNSPWQHVAANLALDPLNLVGVGLPTKAIQAVPAGGKLYKALKVAEAADTLPGKLTAPVFDLAGKGIGKTVEGAAGFLRPHAEDFARVHPNVAGGIDNVMRGWREQALLSPGYHLRNLSEGIIRPVTEGRMDTAGEVIRNVTGRSRWDTDAVKYGLDRDANILKEINQDPTGTAKTGSVFRKVDFAPKPKPSNPVRIPNPGSSVPDGTFANHLSTDARGKHHQAVVLTGDAVQLGDTAHFTNIGTGARTGPASGKILDIVEEPTGRYYFDVEFAPGGKRYSIDPSKLQSHTPGPGYSTGTTTAAPNLAQRAGNFATGKVADAMDLNREVGMGLEGRMRKAAILTEYEKAIREGATHQQAIDGAIQHSKDLFFDYADNGPMDQLGRGVFAFHKFGTHNLPAQLKASGRTPAIMNVPSQYYRDSDEYNKQHGLPSRFHGELPIGSDGWHINPMALSSMGQLMGAASKRTANDNEGTGLGEVADTAQGLGLGLNPFIDAMLTVTGQHGRSFAPSFLRASQPVNGILSSLMDRPVDLEGVPKELLGNLQEAITGQRPFPYQEYLLNKRRAELRDLGGDPSKAGQQVGDQMLAEGLAGFIGIPGLKQLTPEEQTIRQNSALAKAYSLVGNQPGYKANPTARTYADLDPRDEQVANWNTLSASERQRLLRDPEVRDQLLDKLALQLHNTQGKGKSNPNPFMRAKGSTTDRSPATSAAQAKAKAQDYQQAMLMIRRMQASADAVQARQKR